MTAGLSLWPIDDEDVATTPLGAAWEDVVAHPSERLPDPLRRLLDPEFRDVVWLYEGSKVEPEIPGKLHPKQVEMLKSEARHRWLFWGNQVGKTSFGAIDLSLLCLGRHPVQKWQPPIKCWASALTWELWENILLPELLTWIPQDRIVSAPPPGKQSTRRTIIVRADNGKLSTITGKAAEQGAARYQSARIHRFWGDEEHPEAVYDEVMPRLLRHGGDGLWTMTPLKGLTWVHDRIYEPWKQGRAEAKSHFCSHAGIEDNPSVTQEAIDELKNELRNNPSQLAARLSGLFVRPVGAVLPFDPDKMLEDMTRDTIAGLMRSSTPFAGLDLGKWRWALTLFVADKQTGIVYLIDEVFSQYEDNTARAKKLHDLMVKYDVPTNVGIRADCADPKSVTELNNALEAMGSPYFVSMVAMRNKIIKAGVDRIENLMNRGAFKVRRGLGNGMNWRLGMNSNKPGKPVEGSRWIWEVNNWQYPKMPDGKIQKDEPDDATADGADAMDSTRYAILSWWEVEQPKEPTPKAQTIVQRLQRELEEMDEEAESARKGSRYGGILRQ